MWGKGTLIHCWWECKLVQPLWKTVWRLLKKLNIELLYNPAIPLQYHEKQAMLKEHVTNGRGRVKERCEGEYG
jgi:hypothetical protein